jgi:selenocysteine lyase/cysteine desulfurase
MDQTVPAARITNDPITRGYRVYYGESVEEVAEEDLSKAFGYQETSGKTPIQTIKILDKMGVDNALERAEEFGKDVKLDKKKKKGSDMRIRITEKEKISEIQKKKMEKMVEDILMKKKNSNNSEISKKQMEDGVSSIIKKNIKSLLKQAEIEGLSKKDLIKMLNGE